MANPPRQIEVAADEDLPELTISPEKVCFVIIKAREFDAKDAITDAAGGGRPRPCQPRRADRELFARHAAAGRLAGGGHLAVRSIL
jgi:hypothetical protein